MSFEAAALLDRLTVIGCILALGDGGKLSVKGCVLTDEMQSAIRAHKPDLIASLQNEGKLNMPPPEANLDAILTEACSGVEGITPSQLGVDRPLSVESTS